MATKYKVIAGLLNQNEADSLRAYLEPIIGNASSHTLSNRPDAWDPYGYIERGLTESSRYFQELIFPTPLDRVGFYIRRTGEGLEVLPTVELDDSRDAQVHEINRKIAVLYLNEDYTGGETNFVNHGESFKPNAGDLVLYEVDELNRVGTEKVTSGSKLELVYMYMEIVPKTRFDEFYMPPMEDDSDRF